MSEREKNIRFENFLMYEKALLWISVVAFGITVIWVLLSFFTDILPHGKIIVLPVFTFVIGLVCLFISLVSVLRRYYTK